MNDKYTKYNGYYIIADPAGDGFNVYDPEFELFDEGFGSISNAQKAIDDQISIGAKRLLNAMFPKSESKEDSDDHDDDDGDYSTLIIALESEKDAIDTYNILIEETEDEETKNLLNKILDDEKEHIALLSALQAKIASTYVAKDAEKTFNGFMKTKTSESVKAEIFSRYTSNDGYVSIEDVANFITEAYDGDIDDRYECIASVIKDYKEDGKVSTEVIDQYAGGHNLNYKV